MLDHTSSVPFKRCFTTLFHPGGYASYGALIADNDTIAWEWGGLVVPELNPDSRKLETTNNFAEYAGCVHNRSHSDSNRSVVRRL